MSNGLTLSRGVETAATSPPAVETWERTKCPAESSPKYIRAPSVSMVAFLARLSLVIWVTPMSLGGGKGERNHQAKAAIASRAAKATIAQGQRPLLLGSTMDALAALTLPEVVSRLRRVRSARMSAALW